MSVRLELVRLEHSQEGVFGVLKIDDEVFCCTLEPKDLDNRQNVSCIPTGTYRCQRRISARFGETYEVTHVPGRSHILMHAGNSAADTSGCILLGSGYLREEWGRGIAQSRKAIQRFMQRLAGRDCELTISAYPGVSHDTV